MKRFAISLLLSFGLTAVAQAARPFSETWTGKEYVLGRIYVSGINTWSEQICLGQAQWSVTGNINGRAFSEDWVVSSFINSGTLLANDGVPVSGLYTSYAISDAVSKCTLNNNGDFIEPGNLVFQPTGLYGVMVTGYDPEGTENGLDLSFTALRAMPKEWFISGTIQDE